MWNSLAALYAIVVGHNGAPSPDVAPLRYADDDAANYARLFRDAGAEVTLLTRYDADTQGLYTNLLPDGPPTHEKLWAAVQAVPANAEVFLIYTGHGDVADGQGFVQLEQGRLTRAELYGQLLPQLRTSRVHLLVDACKSYFLVFDRGPGGARRSYDGQFVDARGAEQFPSVGFILSTSSAADSHEWEEWQAGVFSHEVRSALRGGADVNSDGRVSYLELGAFIRQANQGILNPRFRPRFTVVPPRASPEGPRTPLITWGNAAAARPLLVDPPPGRFLLEDAQGIRLADAHPESTVPLVLHVPPGVGFVRALDTEWELPAEGRVRLGDLIPRPLAVASRGALHEAFKHLFSLSFGPAAVDSYARAPAQSIEATEETESSTRRTWRTISGWTTLGMAVAGMGLTATAYGIRHGADNDQASRAEANETIGVLNGVALACYATAGAAGTTWLALTFWPGGAAASVQVPLR